MGGRGKSSGLGVRQLTLDDGQRQHMISEIVKDASQQRTIMENRGFGQAGRSSSPSLFKKCACCGEYTLAAGTEYEICHICGWIDDPYQNRHPKSEQGKNSISLVEARKFHQESISVKSAISAN
ncbi:MAG: hypothetical protein FWC91_02005 [Defluviitaleaceae bacterium]|nr:hypothetical protein [Defluviitaleaceae bacterium]